jgi:hypothetical protein
MKRLWFERDTVVGRDRLRNVPLLIERIQKPKVRHFREYSFKAVVDTWVDGYDW